MAAVVAAFLACGALLAWRAPDIHDLLAGDRAYVTWAIAWPLAAAAALAFVALVGSAISDRAKVAGTLLAFMLVAMHVVEVAVVHYMLPGYHFRYAEVPPETV